jgi:hypothetical protein
MMLPSAREGTIDEPFAYGSGSPPFFSYLDRLAWLEVLKSNGKTRLSECR